MMIKALRERVRRRHRGIAQLLIITVILCFIYYCMQKLGIIDGFWPEFIMMLLSAMISTTLAIYMTKDDIMENDYSEKKDTFGILTIENGYEKVFENGDCREYLKATNWQQFFQGASDKKISIVGVHVKGFFENQDYRNCLLKLCVENGYSVEIIIANPYSDEVIRQSRAEGKPEDEYIKNKILGTYRLFQADLAKIQSAGNINFKILFSDTLPKALIFKAGQYMIVSPYLLESPSQAPTLIVEDSRAISFYENYERYIERLKAKSYSFETLPKHILASSYFTQSYRDLSDEFKADLNKCKSLRILGLGQKHMITQTETKLINLLQRGGTLEAVLTDPEGNSTEMCVRRSIIHDKVEEARFEHKIAINRLVALKQKYGAAVNVYKWDCFFPYTMYAFNFEDRDNTKVYIWITNLFEEANKRLGFVVEGKDDPEIVESFFNQYNGVLGKADRVEKAYPLDGMKA